MSWQVQCWTGCPPASTTLRACARWSQSTTRTARASVFAGEEVRLAGGHGKTQLSCADVVAVSPVRETPCQRGDALSRAAFLFLPYRSAPFRSGQRQVPMSGMPHSVIRAEAMSSSSHYSMCRASGGWRCASLESGTLRGSSWSLFVHYIGRTHV